MKELSIEEKAKRYDEAYKVAKNIHIFSSDLAEIKRMEEIFPELKEESEGERIKKRICKLLWDNAPYEEAQEYIAWLEKQGEQKPVIEMKTPEESLGIDSNTYNKIVDECIYGEQPADKSEPTDYNSIDPYFGKPIDKVEPKFKIGDWIVLSTSDGEKVVQIDSIEYFKSGEPRYITSEGRWFGNATKARLWTIQDAKDGDVLFQDLMGGKTFIYNGINPDMAILYSFIINNDGEDVLPYHIGKPNTGIGYVEENKNIIHPATKEQRDTLMKAMANAGYNFDFEKKELKKIEQKPAWSKEDERIYQSIMDDTVQENQLNDKQTNWLRDIKYRYFTQPKQEWSEEDSPYYDDICEILINLLHSETADVNKDVVQKDLDWLKSLRPQNRWKPSDKQMEVLWKYAEQNNYDGMILTSLYNDLKKLKE